MLPGFRFLADAWERDERSRAVSASLNCLYPGLAL